MGQMFTLLLLLAVGVIVLIKVVRADSRAKKAKARSLREAVVREDREQELLDRLERVKKKKSDLEAAKRVIHDDPARAAKVVSKMMRNKD